MPERIRVLHIIDSLGLGGAQVYLKELAAKIDQDTFTLTICALRQRPSFVKDELQRAGAEIVELETNLRNPLFPLLLTYKLRKLIRSVSPHIVHVHLAGSKIFGRYAALRERVPCILSHEHSTYQGANRFPFVVFVDRWLTQRSCGGIAISNHLQSYIARQNRLPPSMYSVIPNFIDTERFRVADARQQIRRELGLEDGWFVVGYVGRLVEKKDPAGLVQSFANIVSDYPSTRLLLAGSGPEESRIRRLVKQRKLTDQVLLLGARADIPELLKAFDLLVVPSQADVFPVVALEGMASETPVIAARTGGLAEIIEHNVSGLLFAPGNTQAMEEAMRRAIENPQDRTRWVQNAIRRVREKYDWRVVVPQIEQLYKELHQAHV